MEIPRPALVTQLKLHLSAEGRGFTYLLADEASGKILRLSRAAALAYDGFSRVVAQAGVAAQAGAGRDGAGRAGGPRNLSQGEMRSGLQALSMVRRLRDSDRFPTKRFNPLMMNFPLFELGPFQPRFARLARHVFGAAGALGAVLLVAVALFMSIRNDWAIVDEFNGIFSLDALLTFGLIAPFLKLIHEFGHFLAATAFGVRLRKAGVNVIGLFPMPYVDATDADLSAPRWVRVMIAAAGILTDFVIGAVLLIGWHLVDNGFWQLVLGRAFVYNTLTTLTFNANPLMRADGYFILADLVGRRNLATEAQIELRRLRARIFGTAVEAGEAMTAGRLALLGYAVASLVYRISVMIWLVWAILPRYLGLGFAVGIWGTAVMAQTQIDANRQAAVAQGAAQQGAGQQGAGQRFGPRTRGAAFLAVAVAALFVPLSSVVVIEVSPDVATAHSVTVARGGTVTGVPPFSARVAQGETILTLDSTEAENALALARLSLVEAEITAQMGRGVGAAEDQAGAERLERAKAHLRLAEQDLGLLRVRAATAGRFILRQPLRTGAYLRAGQGIGQLLPDTEPLVLTGTFPEGRVTAYKRGLRDVTLWDGATYAELAVTAAHLAEQPRMDKADMTRGFTLRLVVPPAAVPVAAYAPQVRLRFVAVPVWQHLADWGSGLLSRFRDAEIAERQHRIDAP